MTEHLLSARDVRKNYGPTTALDGASVVIDAGRVTALVGPSGSGKSTLLLCLAGIVRADSGEVVYQGKKT